MPIKGLTERRRMPRIGKFHLGIKVTKNKKGEDCAPYPRATDYFVYPEEGSAGFELIDELIREYGEKPKELPVIFPLEDEEAICSQYYRCYSRSRGLICRGDGETCMRMIDTSTGDLVNKDSEKTELKEMSCEGRECPNYAKGNCREIMNLQFMLPKISGLGVWQIDTSSINSIRNINSCLELIRSVYGRVRMVPLFLSIEPMEVTPPNTKKKTVHVLNLRSMDNMIQAALNARKQPLELILGSVGIEQAQKDVDEAWPPDEQDRMLSSGEAEERMTPEEIETAKLAEELFDKREDEREPEHDHGPPEVVQEDLEFDSVWLKDSLHEIKWSDATVKSYLSNVCKIDTEGTVTEVVSRLTREQRENFFAEIQKGLDKKQQKLL